ncbi:Crp/Fnr family transcriptional regulator [Catenuloplanes atrovinosus]|uniref:CRP-like cAMP-binding protein n=1 Tax=Catenuloplanes atrovinosus TaxID=137266 RepID=A0AAE4CAC3_9ACTN|nr:Crp/Fnr family transcriptional regulator [Catenuloplanes atrovinosus]MDR7277466.1 CRP-like cAMP-binding protein [Catenuloplanes atrovinosus]
MRAIDRVEARLVAASLFRRFLQRNPDALHNLLEAVIVRLREADRRRLEFTGWDVHERVCSLLAELVHTHGRPGPGGSMTIGLALSQEEIAGATGASREAVAKALRTLRTVGAITTSRKKIVVIDLLELRRFIDGNR